MNTFHSAIQQATSNGLHSELCDLWRIYHPTSLMIDCEYPGLDLGNKLLGQESLDFRGYETRRNDELKNHRNPQKRLYVPVTRKVSSEIRKN